MHFWELPDQASVLRGQALRLLDQHAIAPTPHNYELWFAYAIGEDPALVETLDRAARDGRARDTIFGRELHSQYFERGDTAQLDAANERLREEMKRLAAVLDATGQGSSTYGKMLSTVAEQLGRGMAEPVLATVVQGLTIATRAMEAKNKALETQMTESSGEIETLRQSMESIKTQSLLDPLTGLANRRAFDESLAEAVAQSTSEGAPLSLFIADIDHFKRFNDTWGHTTGDHVLRLVGNCFKSNVKGRDTAARFGGEEFVVILPGTKLLNAMTVADQIRLAVASKNIVKKSTGETLGSITISAGVAQYVPGEDAETMIERADSCLYAAKSSGRNRVVSEQHADDKRAG